MEEIKLKNKNFNKKLTGRNLLVLIGVALGVQAGVVSYASNLNNPTSEQQPILLPPSETSQQQSLEQQQQLLANNNGGFVDDNIKIEEINEIVENNNLENKENKNEFIKGPINIELENQNQNINSNEEIKKEPIEQEFKVEDVDLGKNDFPETVEPNQQEQNDNNPEINKEEQEYGEKDEIIVKNNEEIRDDEKINDSKFDDKLDEIDNLVNFGEDENKNINQINISGNGETNSQQYQTIIRNFSMPKITKIYKKGSINNIPKFYESDNENNQSLSKSNIKSNQKIIKQIQIVPSQFMEQPDENKLDPLNQSTVNLGLENSAQIGLPLNEKKVYGLRMFVKSDIDRLLGTELANINYMTNRMFRQLEVRRPELNSGNLEALSKAVSDKDDVDCNFLFGLVSKMYLGQIDEALKSLEETIFNGDYNKRMDLSPVSFNSVVDDFVSKLRDGLGSIIAQDFSDAKGKNDTGAQFLSKSFLENFRKFFSTNFKPEEADSQIDAKVKDFFAEVFDKITSEGQQPTVQDLNERYMFVVKVMVECIVLKGYNLKLCLDQKIESILNTAATIDAFVNMDAENIYRYFDNQRAAFEKIISGRLQEHITNLVKFFKPIETLVEDFKTLFIFGVEQSKLSNQAFVQDVIYQCFNKINNCFNDLIGEDLQDLPGNCFDFETIGTDLQKTTKTAKKEYQEFLRSAQNDLDIQKENEEKFSNLKLQYKELLENYNKLQNVRAGAKKINDRFNLDNFQFKPVNSIEFLSKKPQPKIDLVVESPISMDLESSNVEFADEKLVEENTSLKEKIKELENNMVVLNNVQENNQILINRIQELEESCNLLGADNNSLSNKVLELEEQAKLLQVTLDQRKEEVDQLNERIQELSDEKDQNAIDYQEKIEKLNLKLKDQEEEVAKSKEEYNQLMEEYDAAVKEWQSQFDQQENKHDVEKEELKNIYEKELENLKIQNEKIKEEHENYLNLLENEKKEEKIRKNLVKENKEKFQEIEATESLFGKFLNYCLICAKKGPELFTPSSNIFEYINAFNAPLFDAVKYNLKAKIGILYNMFSEISSSVNNLGDGRLNANILWMLKNKTNLKNEILILLAKLIESFDGFIGRIAERFGADKEEVKDVEIGGLFAALKLKLDEITRKDISDLNGFLNSMLLNLRLFCQKFGEFSEERVNENRFDSFLGYLNNVSQNFKLNWKFSEDMLELQFLRGLQDVINKIIVSSDKVQFDLLSEFKFSVLKNPDIQDNYLHNNYNKLKNGKLIKTEAFKKSIHSWAEKLMDLQN